MVSSLGYRDSEFAPADPIADRHYRHRLGHHRGPGSSHCVADLPVYEEAEEGAGSGGW